MNMHHQKESIKMMAIMLCIVAATGVCFIGFSCTKANQEKDWMDISGKYRTFDKEGKKLEQYSWGGPSCLTEDRYYEGENTLELWSCTTWPNSPWKSTIMTTANQDGNIDLYSIEMKNLPKGSPMALWYKDMNHDGAFDLFELWLGGANKSDESSLVYRDLDLNGQLDYMYDKANKKEYIMFGMTWTEATKEKDSSGKNIYIIHVNGANKKASFSDGKWCIEGDGPGKS